MLCSFVFLAVYFNIILTISRKGSLNILVYNKNSAKAFVFGNNRLKNHSGFNSINRNFLTAFIIKQNCTILCF